MSLYSALNAGVSGLSAQSSAMATVADNIINVNTVGYKAVRADFTTMVGNNEANSRDYSAGGVQSVAKQTISQNGLLAAASRNSDLAIDGNGFFIVRDGAGTGAQTVYTRTGNFAPDSNGNLLNTAGYYLQGWPIGANGQVTANGNPNALETVNINKLSGLAEATSNLAFQINLQSTTTASATAYTVGDMSNFADDPATGQAPQFSRTLDVYDAQGNAHQVSIGFIKTDTNEWQVEVYAKQGEVSNTDGVLASGTLAFNADGSIDFGNTSAGLLNAAGTGFATITPNWTNGAGTAPINLKMGSDKGFDGITQNSDAFAARYSSDGGLLGDVTDVSVSKEGMVSAVFEDGSTRPIYQLALAAFSNPDGLTAIAGGAYIQSGTSGLASIGIAGAGGSGLIASKQLEQSTADVATEFTNMIKFQRAYSASSKIITTVDQMLQELGNLKN